MLKKKCNIRVYSPHNHILKVEDQIVPPVALWKKNVLLE